MGGVWVVKVGEGQKRTHRTELKIKRNWRKIKQRKYIKELWIAGMTKRTRDDNTKRTSKVTFHFVQRRKVFGALMNICPFLIQTMFRSSRLCAHKHTNREKEQERQGKYLRLHFHFHWKSKQRPKLHIINFGIIALSCTDWLNARSSLVKHTKQHDVHTPSLS